MKTSEIDIDFELNNESTLSERKSISFLLGAGFSVPKGYPTGKEMNDRLLDFDVRRVDFSPSGTLVVSVGGDIPHFQIGDVKNIYQKVFIFCKRLIKEYAKAHSGDFDYELFYDFIRTEEVKEHRYVVLCNDLLTGTESYEGYLSKVPAIYSQMVALLLKDREGRTFYNDEPFKISGGGGYNGFLKYLSNLKQEYVMNVHTLNHDLLFESFNHTLDINGSVSDGFDEYGSDYYGNLVYDKGTYRCRLERYTGRYNTPIRLFKLHGSLDYVLFYRKGVNCSMIPERYVKIKYGIGTGDIMKSYGTKMKYELSPYEYHADFLTGTTSKIRRYKEPLLFKKLFKKFKNNLRCAERLIIIGYGCKDEEINNIIKEYYDFKHKPVFIIDKYASDKVVDFGQEINAKIIQQDVENIDSSVFDTSI